MFGFEGENAREKGIVLLTMCFALAMAMLDNTVVNVALPRIQDGLGASLSSLQWIVDGYVLAFASLLWEGVHKYTYVARATTPGTFVVPPPKAEEMYMPETFGRGASDRVIVE